MTTRVRLPNENGPSSTTVVVFVGVAVVTVSFAAIFVRFADSAPALSIAFWRNAIGAACLAPFALRRRRDFPTGRARLHTILAGLMLALHFALWIASLSRTTVAASVVLVCTQPIFVAMFAGVFLGERPRARTVVGIVVAVVGAAIIGGADIQRGSVDGDALALGGAVAVAVYVLLGRSVRSTTEIPLVVYTFMVYGTAASMLLFAASVSGASLTGFSSSTWLAIGALALGPQLLGHTLINWALKWVRAPVLSSTILLEPVISTALAWALLAEIPPSTTLVGGGVILVGLVIVIFRR